MTPKGGKRPGAGRPAKEDKMETFAIRFPPEMIEAAKELNLAPDLRGYAANLIQWRKAMSETEEITLNELAQSLVAKGGVIADETLVNVLFDFCLGKERQDLEMKTYETSDFYFVYIAPNPKWNRFHGQPKDADYILIGDNASAFQSAFMHNMVAVCFPDGGTEPAFREEAWLKD